MESQFQIDRSTFLSNSAAAERGAVWITRFSTPTRTGRARVIDSEFVENKARGEGGKQGNGGAFTSYFPTLLEGSLFKKNNANHSGGGLFAGPSIEIEVQRNRFFENGASAVPLSSVNRALTGEGNTQYPAGQTLVTPSAQIETQANSDSLKEFGCKLL